MVFLVKNSLLGAVFPGKPGLTSPVRRGSVNALGVGNLRISTYEHMHAPQNVQDISDYAVGWFTLSLINAGLAQSKGRSGSGWWFASLFLGPICTLLIVVTDPVKPKP